jgi:hypothetical protein
MVENRQFENDAVPHWTLHDWNRALYHHFFGGPPSEIVVPLVRLYVTTEDLRAAFDRSCTPEQSRTAFIESIKRALGPRSLSLDASRRRRLWHPDAQDPPPFLSHLLLTCMVANDLAEELRWTGNFRDRLSQTLGTQSQPLLERLRPLWEDLASWSVRQNLAGTGCRPLRLPQVPQSGKYSIIGYSLRLASPSRRDQTSLVALFRQHNLIGPEPDLNSVLSVVGSAIGKFSAEFQDVFSDFVYAVRSLPSGALFHTTFWKAVREVALSGRQPASRGTQSIRTRLELEDDDGQFWLALTCDTEIQSVEMKTVELPTARRSPFQFVLLTDPAGNSLVDQAFSSATSDPKTECLIASTREAIVDGVLLFEETEDYVYVLSSSFPSSGQVCALVADRLNLELRQAVETAGLRPEVTKASRPGWTEWRGLTAEGLERANLSSFPSLFAIHSLRRTLTAPEIRIRGGIRFGSSYIAFANALPYFEVPGAESVGVELAGGEWAQLKHIEGIEDCWGFSVTVPEKLLGTRRIVAFATSLPIAEKGVSFVENAFTTEYKEPQDQSRWLVESTRIDLASFSEEAVYVTSVPYLSLANC